MFIRLTCECLKEIYKYCGGAMDAKVRRPEFRFIQVVVAADGITAYALDGYRLAKIRRVPEAWEGEGKFFLPVTKVPKGAAYCEISAKKDSAELVFSDGTMFCSKYPDPGFPSTEALDTNLKRYDEPKFSIWVDPRLMAEALKALQTGKNAVRIDFFSEMSPVVMHRVGDFKEDRIMVFPVAPPKKK